VTLPRNRAEFIGRGVPDVAGHADPQTGYALLIDGEDTIVGGTGSAAAMWAALIALMNQALGRPLGFVNPQFYGFEVSQNPFRDITQGNNGEFSAGPGWDACTGLGTPNGGKILSLLRK
jgi:kumamolisin